MAAWVIYWLMYPRVWLVFAGFFAVSCSAQVGLIGRDFIVYGHVFKMVPRIGVDAGRIIRMRRFVKRQYRVRILLILCWLGLALFALLLFVFQIGG